MSSIFPQNQWSGPRYHDPWWKAEQWRYEHPIIGTKYIWRRALPGFGWASAAFALFCAADYAYSHSTSAPATVHSHDKKASHS
jgi:hypothetical protein